MPTILHFLQSVFGVETAFANPIPYGGGGDTLSPLLRMLLPFPLTLGLTIAIEVLVVVLLSIVFLRSEKMNTLLVALVVALATTTTLTLLWFVFLPLVGNILLLEVVIVLVEASIYRHFLPTRWTYALLFSFVANVASFAASPLIPKILNIII